jgi:hypothetical protein
MKTKLFVSLLVVALLAATVGVAAAAPAPAPTTQAGARNTVAGDVTAVEANVLTLHTLQGDSVTVQTNARTRYRAKDNPNFTLANIQINDRLIVNGQWVGGRLHANLIALVPADMHDGVAGRVASINGATLVVTKRDGSSLNVLTTSDTVYHNPNIQTPAFADIKVGDMLQAAGVLNGDTLTAAQVRFNTPPARTPGPIALGKIASINGNTLTLSQPFGETLTVNTDASTFVVQRGQGGPHVISLSDLTVGEGVMVIGPRSSDGSSITARVILAGAGQATTVNPGRGSVQPQAPFGQPAPQGQAPFGQTPLGQQS